MSAIVEHVEHVLHQLRLYKLLMARSACVLLSDVAVEQRTCARVCLNSIARVLEYERISLSAREIQ